MNNNTQALWMNNNEWAFKKTTQPPTVELKRIFSYFTGQKRKIMEDSYRLGLKLLN